MAGESNMTSRPEWWSWEIKLSVHLLGRMKDRQFNEADLRLMLEDASGYYEDRQPGRHVVETRLEGRRWEVIVEPVPEERALVVVTAYPLQSCD